jgi:DHA3 family macrolide efflux protein-like MFS transporter
MRRPAGFKGFSIMSIGQIISITGSAMTQFGIGIWIWETTGNATPFSIIATAFFIPNVIFSPIAGALIDRWPRKRSLILPDLAAGIVTISILILLILNRLNLGYIYVAAFIEGTFNAFQWPAYSVTISVMLKKEEYSRANGLFSMTDSAPTIIAPIAAGALISFIGLKGIMTIDIITFLFAIGAVLWVIIPENVIKEKVKVRILKDSLFGFEYIFARKALLALLLIFLLTNFFTGFYSTLFTPLILSKTNNSSVALGAVQTTFGVGGIAGGLLMTAWGGTKRKVKTLLIGILLSGAGSIFLGFSKTLPMLLISAVVIAVPNVAANASSQAIWQSKVKPALQGRVFTARRVIAQLIAVIPMLVSGPFVDHILGPYVSSKPILTSVFGSAKGGAISMLAAIGGLVTIIVIIIGFSIPLLMHVEDINYDTEESESKISPDAEG